MDLSDGITKKLDISGVIGFSKYEKDKIIILSSDSINNTRTGFYFKIFNYKKSVVENEFETNITRDRFCYDLNNNLILYAGSETIYSMDIDNKNEQTIYSTQDTIFLKISIVDNMLYCADMKGQVVHIVDINSQIKANQQLSLNTIKVFSNNKSLSSSTYGKKGVDIFKKNNPGVEVLFEFIDGKEYEQKLKLKLMAGDSDFDVFIVNNNILPELLRNQAFYDLSSFDSIQKTLNSMTYGIKQLCSAGETIIGVPEHISLDVWSVNESLLESLGLHLPEDSWSWDDFYEFSVKARKDLNSDGEMDTYAMACGKQFFISRFMLRNYNCSYLDVINGHASFNREEYVDLVKLSKKLFDEKLIMENNDVPITKLDYTLFTMQSLSSIEKNEKIIPVPSLSSKRVYPAGVSLFCV
ncbi:MAG: ABC transporter substrate-binding protein, partial [Dysgonamonadaceae bacterium]|nr:ABC transporter substrate-binding protein [Dysgonamonadaceae bacterium]